MILILGIVQVAEQQTKMKCVNDTMLRGDKKEMKCKLCGKANHTHSKNTAHSWVKSQHCGYCHYLGLRYPYSNFKPKGKKVLTLTNK